jgi:hypothetical protein
MTKHDGDYELRTRGLEALFRCSDLVEWDVLRTEMAAGVSSGDTHCTPYIILRAYAGLRGVSIGAKCTRWEPGHPMGYLAHAILLQGEPSLSPILVTTAFEELLSLRTSMGL